MDNWIELLIPVIIVLIYLFQRIWGGNDEAEGGPPRDESQVSEEARKIQEEIRRKIVARQQGRDPAEPPSPREPVAERREPVESPESFERYGRTADLDERTTGSFGDASRPDEFERYGRAAEPDERGGGRFRDPTMPDEFERYGEESPGAGPFAPPAAPGRDYEAELREQLARVKESKKARQHAARRSRETVRKAPGEIGSAEIAETGSAARRAPGRYPSGSRGAFLEELRTRGGLQKAFVLKEVLGEPVGVRSGGDTYAEFSRDR